MKHFILIALAFFASPVFAETCYQLSTDGVAFSRTPEQLCVDETDGIAVTLKTGLPFDERTVATFNLDLLRRLRCFDCNGDVFGLRVPSNSIFNTLQIKFEGTRTVAGETGKVWIGQNMYFYRSMP